MTASRVFTHSTITEILNRYQVVIVNKYQVAIGSLLHSSRQIRRVYAAKRRCRSHSTYLNDIVL